MKPSIYFFLLGLVCSAAIWLVSEIKPYPIDYYGLTFSVFASFFYIIGLVLYTGQE